VKRDDTYNMCIGGRGGREGMVPVIDMFGNKHVVFNTNPKYLNG
jgi:hypothetical protein